MKPPFSAFANSKHGKISRQPVGVLHYEHRIASSVLRDAVAEVPILFRGVIDVHKHVLRPNAGAFAEQLHDPPAQRFLLFQGAGIEHGDLDVHEIGAPGDAVGITVAEVRRVMLRDGHELVVFGHVQRFAHRAVKAVEDRLPVGFRLSDAQ